MIEKRELCNQRKREVLNRKWNEHVYDPIRRALLAVSRRRSEEAERERQRAAASAEAEGDIWSEVIARKQQLYSEFIDYSNKKVEYLSHLLKLFILHIIPDFLSSID